ncbi:metallophosphoesterase family protein [Paenibacillus thalictri]|nr:metallophosphoesterase [Paenibacillus thalictri]
MIKGMYALGIMGLIGGWLAGAGHAGAAEPLLAFPVISDVHAQSFDELAAQKLQAALADLNEVNPQADALIVNGDLGDGSPRDYAALSRILQKTPHPRTLFFTIGNHEYYQAWHDQSGKWNMPAFPNGETEAASIRRFLQLTGEPTVYYDKWLNGYHFIFLGSERYRQSDSQMGEDAYLSAGQLEWLQERLQAGGEPAKPVFVFLHQPLPDTVSGSGAERGVVQHRELAAILGRYPQVILFSGHTHARLGMAQTMVRDRFTMIGSSSVYEPYDDDGQRVPQKLRSSEGLYVEVYEDRVMLRGRDFTHQKWIPEVQFKWEPTLP